MLIGKVRNRLQGEIKGFLVESCLHSFLGAFIYISAYP
jgi:hypothetical protein